MVYVKKHNRWSLKYDFCRECKKTLLKHHGNGYCVSCYSRNLKSINLGYRANSLLRTQKWNKKIRLLVLSHYSITAKPSCACCLENTLEFLAIDHIDNNGTEHRKITKGSGSKTYVWLYKNDFPKGFQVLCHNCNMAKGFYGECPHLRMNESKVTQTSIRNSN